MLIFDSGIGGLSILKTIKKILPNINYIYLLDNEAFPYGNKTDFFIIERSIKIINTIKKQYSITIVVVACNTVSTVAVSILRKRFNFPIIGVFPSIKKAEKKTKNKIIGLIATKGTINSSYTKKILYNKSSYHNVKIIGTNKLAIIAEKKVRGIIVSKIELEKIFKIWINLQTKPDTIILGCTHFSWLKEEIKNVLYTPCISFIDSKSIVISQIKNYFNTSIVKQNIKNNVLLYSKNQNILKELLFFLKEYKFNTIKHIKLK